MDHHPHVRLVYAHPEGVGSDNDLQIAADEPFLNVLLGLGRPSCVEVVRPYTLGLQELRDLLSVTTSGAVDDGSSRLVLRQVGGQYLVNTGQLLPAAGLDYDKFQVGPL